MYNNSKTFYVTFFILNENLQRHHLSNGSDGTYCIVYPHVASLRGVCFVEQVIVSFIAPVPVTHVSTVSVVLTVVNQNSNLEERTDIKDTRVSQKGTKKIGDGEDSLGVETTNLKKKTKPFRGFSPFLLERTSNDQQIMKYTVQSTGKTVVGCKAQEGKEPIG